MFYQGEGERKPPVTECTVVRSLLRMMSTVVFSKVYCLAEVFPTLGALVRLLSGVNAQMDPKLCLLMKSLSTVIALVRLVFITRLLVSCKLFLLKRIWCFNAWEEIILLFGVRFWFSFNIFNIWYSGTNYDYGKVFAIIRLTLFSRMCRVVREFG